jgi:basic membrane protein A and related proteins
MSERKVVSRTVAIALGLVCVLLGGSLVAAVGIYISTISGMNSRISDLESQSSSLSETNDGLEDQISDLQDQADALQGELETHEDQVSDLQGQVGALQDEIQNIRASPGKIEIKTLTIAPSSVMVGSSVSISVGIENPGETTGSGTIVVALNDVVEATKNETLAAGETKTVIFTVSKDGGIYTVTIPGTTLTGIFTVEPVAEIGLILATGGLGDKAFNDISYAGVQRAKDELGIAFDYVEPTEMAQYEGLLRNFSRTGKYELIISVGLDQADALAIVADAYPFQRFAIIDGIVNKPNVASLLFEANEGSFLVGVVAGMKTHSGKVGFVGGIDIPLVRDFFVGYEAGVIWANSTVEVLAPVFVGGWANPTAGKELALGLIDLGVDVIFAAAGKSGLGALEAVHERGVFGIGVDACQCYLYPEVIASMTKRVDTAVFETIKAAIEGTFESGNKTGGLAEQWVGSCRLPEEESFWEVEFGFTHPAIEPIVINKMVEARDKIVAGEVIVPSAY